MANYFFALPMTKPDNFGQLEALKTTIYVDKGSPGSLNISMMNE